jgi:hypothetical protein
MPVQDFALDPAATHRVQVHWTSNTDPATVMVNRSILGSLSTVAERVAGKNFTLPDGSMLHIRFVNGQPQAFRNGYPLAIAPAIPETSVLQKKRGGSLTIWLIANLILIIFYTAVYFLALIGSILGSASSRPLAYLVFMLIGCVGIVGIGMLFAWKKWGFYLIVFFVVANFLAAILLGIFNGYVTFFLPFVALATLYYRLGKVQSKLRSM